MHVFPRFLSLLAGIALVAMPRAYAGDWRQINTGVAREAAECVSWSETRVDCLTRTFGNGLSASVFESGSTSLPKNLGGDLAAAPGCVVRGPNGINCFAVTASGVLATIALNGTTWNAWSSLGGTLAPGRASCVTRGTDRISCYARERAGGLLVRNWNAGSSWERWQDLGGKFTGDPQCVVDTGGNAACFGRGSHGALTAWFEHGPDDRPAWTTLAAGVEGRPSCIASGPDTFTCVAAGSTGGLLIWRGTTTSAGLAGTTTRVDTPVRGDPSCAPAGATLHCGWRNTRNELVNARFSPEGRLSHLAEQKGVQIAGVRCIPLSAAVAACVATGRDGTLNYVGAEQRVADARPPVARPMPKPYQEKSANAKEELSGRWYLTDLGSGTNCRAGFFIGGKGKPNPLDLSPACKSMGLSPKLKIWVRDRGSLRFTGSAGTPALHFTPVNTARWLGPKKNSVLVLSRQPETRARTLHTSSAQDGARLASDLRGMAGAWRVMDARARQVCRIELSQDRQSGGYAVASKAECPDLYQGVEYWNESANGLVLVGSGHVVVARFVAAGQDRWRTQSANGVVLVR